MIGWQYPVQQPLQLTQVSGMEGAKAYRMPPNSAVALFHASEDVFYVKTTDGAGFPTIRAFRFSEVDEPQERSELDEIREAIADVKQLIRESTGQGGEPAGDVQPVDADEPAVQGFRGRQQRKKPAADSK